MKKFRKSLYIIALVSLLLSSLTARLTLAEGITASTDQMETIAESGVPEEESIESSEMTEETPEASDQTEETPEVSDPAEETPETSAEAAAAGLDPAEETPALSEEAAAPSEETSAPSNEYPTFYREVLTDGVTVAVSAEAGVFPENASLSVNRVQENDAKKEEIDAALEGQRKEAWSVVTSYTYDIKILDEDGNELQPPSGQSVKVSFTLPEATNANLSADVYHLQESGTSDQLTVVALPVSGEVDGENTANSENGSGTISVETDGFSYYTVEFTYEGKEYVLKGGREIRLSALLSELGLSGDAESWEVSDPELFDVFMGEYYGIVYESTEEESIPLNQGDIPWLLSKKPFDTTEWLKVTIDGIEYEITVTDDNTTQNVPSGISYSGTVSSVNDSYPSILDDPYFQDAEKPTNVKQSGSTKTVSDFAAGLPLSTIYIDNEKVGNHLNRSVSGKFKLLTTDPAIAGGFKLDGTQVTTYEPLEGQLVGYDPTLSTSLKQASPNTITELTGPLFQFTYKDAAILPDGSRAHLRITYSNAKIAVDQRLGVTDTASDLTPSNYEGEIYLTNGASVSHGGTDDRYIGPQENPRPTAYPNQPFTYEQRAAMAEAVKGVTDLYDQESGGTVYPILGTAIDATYQIVDDHDNPINGTFIFAISGINLDRDPYMEVSNNYGKPLWYTKDLPDGEKYQYFSESLRINSSIASDFIYVRPNNDYLDENTLPAGSGYNAKTHYYCQVLLEDGKVKFTGNGYRNRKSSDNPTDYPGTGEDTSYASGFVTMADAFSGLSVTIAGHGGLQGSMNTVVFAAKRIWHRYTSTTGPNGNIQTTSEGNFRGTLNDTSDSGVKSNILDANTYVVPEGKTVNYTLTPNDKYQIALLQIRNAQGSMQEIKYNGNPLSEMQEGDTLHFNDAAGNRCTLTALSDGKFKLELLYAQKDEAVHVEWERKVGELTVKKETDGNVGGSFSFKVRAEKTEEVTTYQPVQIGSVWIDPETGAYASEFNGGAACTHDSNALAALVSGVSLSDRIEVDAGRYLWKTSVKLSDLGISYGGSDDDLFIDYLNAPSAIIGDPLSGPLAANERIYFYYPGTAVNDVTEYWNFGEEKAQDTPPGWYPFTLTLPNDGERKLNIQQNFHYELYEETQTGWELVSIDGIEGRNRVYGLISEETGTTPLHTFLNRKLPSLTIKKETVKDAPGTFDFTVKFKESAVPQQDYSISATASVVDGVADYSFTNSGAAFAMNGITIPAGTFLYSEADPGLQGVLQKLMGLSASSSEEEKKIRLGLENGSVSTDAAQSLSAWAAQQTADGEMTAGFSLSAPGRDGSADYVLVPAETPAGATYDSVKKQYTIQIQNGGSFTFLNLPNGVTYEVTEAEQQDWLLVTSENASGTLLSASPDTKANFTNRKFVALSVEKKVSGNMGDKERFFKFRIEITGEANEVLTLDMSDAVTSFAGDGTLPPDSSTYTRNEILSGQGAEGGNTRDDDANTAGAQILCDADGKAVIFVYLQNGQRAVVRGLPYAASYTVTEAEGNTDGYVTTAMVSGDTDVSENSGAKIKDGSLTFDTSLLIENKRSGAVPTEIHLKNNAFVIAIVLAAIFGVYTSLRLLRRRSEEK